MAEIPAIMICPLCDVEIEMTRNEKVGDELFCTFCESPLKLKMKKESEELFLMEDF